MQPSFKFCSQNPPNHTWHYNKINSASRLRTASYNFLNARQLKLLKKRARNWAECFECIRGLRRLLSFWLFVMVKLKPSSVSQPTSRPIECLAVKQGGSGIPLWAVFIADIQEMVALQPHTSSHLHTHTHTHSSAHLDRHLGLTFQTVSENAVKLCIVVGHDCVRLRFCVCGSVWAFPCVL